MAVASGEMDSTNGVSDDDDGSAHPLHVPTSAAATCVTDVNDSCGPASSEQNAGAFQRNPEPLLHAPEYTQAADATGYPHVAGVVGPGLDPEASAGSARDASSCDPPSSTSGPWQAARAARRAMHSFMR